MSDDSRVKQPNTQGPRSPGEALMKQQDLAKLSDEELVDLIGRLEQKAASVAEVMFKAGYDHGLDDGVAGVPRNPQAAWVRYTTSKRRA